MSNRPELTIKNPDPLSAILTSLQLHAEVYVNADFCGAWAVDTSGSRRMPFHLIGQGEAWLHIEGKPPQRLSTGDLVVFPHDTAHVIAYSEQPPKGRTYQCRPTTHHG